MPYRNYKKYRKFVIENFKKFLNDEIDNHTLNKNLHTIQTELGYDKKRRGTLKCVWFKFTKDDCLSHTINEIWNDIRFGNPRAKEYIIEQIKLAVENPKGLQIYYS